MVAAAGGGIRDALAYLAEPDPLLRLVMEETAVAAEPWHELHVQNGIARAFPAEN